MMILSNTYIISVKHTSSPMTSLTKRWLSSLKAEAEQAAEQIGALRGPVLCQQRRWSCLLDLIEAESQEVKT